MILLTGSSNVQLYRVRLCWRSRADDGTYRQFAFQQVGGVSTDQAAAGSILGSAAARMALGAAAGAAFNGGTGAAVGVGAGLPAGSLVGAGPVQGSAYARCDSKMGQSVSAGAAG
jgi:hypothetical protein